MLSDFQIIARLLVAFRAAEGKKNFSVALVDSVFIPAPWETKDAIAAKMQKAGLVEGLEPYDSDGFGLSLTRSRPNITFHGIEYAVTNEAVREEIMRLRGRAAELPAPLANAVISLSNEPAFEKCQ